MEKRENSAGQLLETIKEYEFRNRPRSERVKDFLVCVFALLVIAGALYVAGH